MDMEMFETIDVNQEKQRLIEEAIPNTLRKLIAYKLKNNLAVVDSQNSSRAESILKPENVLGKGDTSLVIKGSDGTKDVALKIYTSPDHDEATLRELYLDEVEASSKANHPSIDKIIGAGEINITETKKLPVIVKEISKHSLKDIASSDHRLNISDTIIMTRSIASALEYLLETQNAVMTDLNPSNIRQKDNLVWAISDLGMLAHPGSEKFVGLDDEYTAPEIIDNRDDRLVQNQSASPRSEVYSLALVAWNSLTGKDVDRLAYKMAPEKIVTRENLPEPIFAVLKKAASVNPNDRYSSPKDFANALALAAESGDYEI